MRKSIDIAVIDCGSSKVKEICSILKEHGVQIHAIPLKKANDSSFQCFEGVIISGGPRLFTDEGKELISCFDFIETLSLPTLGICLGHQAIGIKHGAEVFRGRENRDKASIRIVRKSPLFTGIETGTLFAEDHCEGIGLADGFELIASSRDYPVEAMACGSKPMFGVQFHPEISGEPGKRLIENFICLASQIS